MAHTRYDDLKKQEELIRTGLMRHIDQNINVLNGPTLNALVRRTEVRPGDYFERDYIDIGTEDPDDLRRDPNSEGSYTWTRITEGTEKAIKVHRRIGRSIFESAIHNTRGMTPEQYMLRVGGGLGRNILREQIGSVLRALVGCLTKQSSTKLDTGEHLITQDLFEAGKKMGDMSQELVAIVGHSSSFWTLVEDQYDKGVTNVTDYAVSQGVPRTLNRPYVQVDDSSLVDDTESPTEIRTLFLKPFAGEVVITSPERVYSDIDLDIDNVALKYTVEYEYNLAIKGFSWDSSVNPNESNLADSANWVMEAESVKHGPGIVIVTHQNT